MLYLCFYPSLELIKKNASLLKEREVSGAGEGIEPVPNSHFIHVFPALILLFLQV